jgi:hypothetical protein
MLPKTWEKYLIDLNVTWITEKDLLWADYVFLSAMNIHKHSPKILRKHGMLVSAGFIMGFDHDTPNILPTVLLVRLMFGGLAVGGVNYMLVKLNTLLRIPTSAL